MSQIHPTAIVDHHAKLAEDVQVGPYAVIGRGVMLGTGCVVESHSVIYGSTVIGKGCRIGPGAYVGLDPQHLGFLNRADRPQTWLQIGDRVIIREGASVHRSIKEGRENATVIGDGCMLMGTAHVAHDCRIGKNVIMANGVLLGGHVEIGDGAFIGGGCAIHQFVRVGRLAIASGNEAFTHDLPPFCAARYGGLKGYNAVGCRRAGLSREAIHALRAAYRCVHTQRNATQIAAAIRANVPITPEVQELLEFIAHSKRGIQASVRFVHPLSGDEGDE